MNKKTIKLIKFWMKIRKTKNKWNLFGHGKFIWFVSQNWMWKNCFTQTFCFGSSTQWMNDKSTINKRKIWIANVWTWTIIAKHWMENQMHKKEMLQNEQQWIGGKLMTWCSITVQPRPSSKSERVRTKVLYHFVSLTAFCWCCYCCCRCCVCCQSESIKYTTFTRSRSEFHTFKDHWIERIQMRIVCVCWAGSCKISCVSHISHALAHPKLSLKYKLRSRTMFPFCTVAVTHDKQFNKNTYDSHWQ